MANRYLTVLDFQEFARRIQDRAGWERMARNIDADMYRDAVKEVQMSDRDGGPAFPVDMGGVDQPLPGMSLRAYIATAALQGVMILEPIEAFRRNDYEGRQAHQLYLPTLKPDEVAKVCCEFADALLAELAK